MFGPNQVGEVMIGNAAATETTATTFVATASDKELAVVSRDGTAAAAGKPFFVLQKATEAEGGIEFSDTVNPRYIDKITVKAYEAEVLGSLKVDGFTATGAVAAKRTYEVEIRVENALSPENFDIIPGYYVTGQVIGSDTATTIRDGIIVSLNKNLARRGGNEFTVAASGTGISVTEQYQPNDPGRNEGRKLLFSVTGKVFENVPTNGQGGNLGYLTTTVLATAYPGNGTGKFATNYEYFCKGYKYDANREVGWPANFAGRTPYYAVSTGIYNTIQIKYFMPRNETSVERQYKVMTILVQKAADTLANNAATNTLLTSIRTASSAYVTVPANLAVV
jgi:hypothetical protein